MGKLTLSKTLGAALGIAAAVALAGPVSAQTKVWRASHQFPGGKGDVRDDMVQMIAKEVSGDNLGLTIQVYPGASLFKPNDQWDALVNGQLDIALFPLDYASGKVAAFSATLMPGLIRSSERAKRIDASPFMTDMRKIIADHGVMVLSDAWFAGGMASKEGCILKPDDLKGVKFRAAGPTFAAMWEAAGANIVTPPSNEIYNAFQTGVVQATDTSLGTFQSMRLYEQVKCLTAPGTNALWMMYEPVLMSKKNFDALSKEQQAAVIKAGKDAQAYYESKSEAVDSEAIKAFKDHNVEVATLSDAQFAAWLVLAKKTSYAEYAKDVPDGQKLLDEALAVK
jgi:TRAP-type transport system periplasmic protein